jgi:hypothetical protein
LIGIGFTGWTGCGFQATTGGASIGMVQYRRTTSSFWGISMGIITNAATARHCSPNPALNKSQRG